ncbi:MAG: PIN domain-containing protein [Candidatus Thorarchaeota archaeon]
MLLDTSFLLPTLGFDVDSKSVYEGLQRISDSSIEIYYSDLNLLECSWQAVRAVKRDEFEHDVYRTGLQSIEKSDRYQLVRITNEAYINAVHLYSLGHKDMIDNLLYSIAYLFQFRFLTLDSTFTEFLIDNELPDISITVDEITLLES